MTITQTSLAALIGMQFTVTSSDPKAKVPVDIYVGKKFSDTKTAEVDGAAVPYVIMQSTTRPTVTIQLAPERASKVLAGEDPSYVVIKVEGEAAAGGEKVVEATAEKHPDDVNAEAAGAAATTDKAAKPAKAKEKKAKPVKEGPAKGDKKAQCAAIVLKLQAGLKEDETLTRKMVVDAFQKEMGISAAMASTYHYKLCKGDWKDALTAKPAETETTSEAAE